MKCPDQHTKVMAANFPSKLEWRRGTGVNFQKINFTKYGMKCADLHRKLMFSNLLTYEVSNEVGSIYKKKFTGN